MSIKYLALATLLVVSSCTNKETVEPTKIEAPISKDVSVSDLVNENRSLRDANTNNIGNGRAFGILLSTGMNYRITDVVYQSTIQKFIRIDIPWFPTQRLPEPIIRTFRVTHKTSSEASVQGSISINGSLFKETIKGSISAMASKIWSNEISDESTMTITVPKQQQAQLETWEKRKGYRANFWVINVIGDPKTATAVNGRLTYKMYNMTGSVFEDSYLLAKYK